jgi:hypothetical protein
VSSVGLLVGAVAGAFSRRRTTQLGSVCRRFTEEFDTSDLVAAKTLLASLRR